MTDLETAWAAVERDSEAERLLEECRPTPPDAAALAPGDVDAYTGRSDQARGFYRRLRRQGMATTHQLGMVGCLGVRVLQEHAGGVWRNGCWCSPMKFGHCLDGLPGRPEAAVLAQWLRGRRKVYGQYDAPSTTRPLRRTSRKPTPAPTSGSAA